MPRKTPNISKKIADALARQLLDVLRHGRPAFDAKGDPIVDAEGKQLRRPATHQDFAAAIKYLEHNDIKADDARDINDPYGAEAIMLQIKAKAREREKNKQVSPEAIMQRIEDAE